MTSVEVTTSMHQARQWASIAVPYAVDILWPGANVYEVENNDHPVCLLLDTQSGIDWLVEYKGAVKGMAVRCQGRRYYEYAMRRYNSPTFTIRKARTHTHYTHISELDKTLHAIHGRAITAVYQLHAYMDVDNGAAQSVVSFGVADRIALYKLAQSNPELFMKNETKDHQRQQVQEFIFIPFKDIPKTVPHKTYDAL